jgi:hypothetical protein
MSDVETPKAFISYSRTNAEHIKWVVELAEELVENGIDVVLDKWHLLAARCILVQDHEQNKVSGRLGTEIGNCTLPVNAEPN